jgi:hypothetical protein
MPMRRYVVTELDLTDPALVSSHLEGSRADA